MTQTSRTTTRNIFWYTGELILPSGDRWTVAQNVGDDDEFSFVFVESGREFDTVEEAKRWIDAGCPPSTP